MWSFKAIASIVFGEKDDHYIYLNIGMNADDDQAMTLLRTFVDQIIDPNNKTCVKYKTGLTSAFI